MQKITQNITPEITINQCLEKYSINSIILFRPNESNKVYMLKENSKDRLKYGFYDAQNHVPFNSEKLHLLLAGAIRHGNLYMFDNYREFAEFIINNNLE